MRFRRRGRHRIRRRGFRGRTRVRRRRMGPLRIGYRM